MRSDGVPIGESASDLGAGWLAPGEARDDSASRRWAPAAIVFAMIVYLCTAPFAVSHLDFTRDVGIAYGIANGERWPLQGPVLNYNLHLGPLWYYLLAIPLRLTHSWLGVVLVVALIASLKFPLAYALGSRIVDPLFGVLWALLLALPGWNSFDVVLVEHTSLVATCTLAFFWMLLRYFETGSARYLYGVALMYSLALHAHPSTYALALVAAPFLLRRWWASTGKWRELVVAAFVFLVPLLPFVASQIVEGPTAIWNAVDYLTTAEGLGKISDFPAVMRGIFMTGPEIVAKSILGVRGASAEAYSVFYGVFWAIVAAGLMSSLAMPQMRGTTITAIVIVAVVALSVVLMRAVTTYYMTFVVLTLLLGVAALGLRSAIAVSGIRYFAYALIACVALLPIALTIGAARTFANGLYPFAIWPLFDVKRPYQEGARVPLMPAYAMSSVADALCTDRTVVAHGALAFHLLHDYALETKLKCSAPPVINLGGTEPRDATHVAGISRLVLRGSVKDSARADAVARAGPLGLFPVKRIVNPIKGESTAPPGTYPPTRSTFGAPERFALQFDARCDEVVVVTNMYYWFATNPGVDAVLNGNPVQPMATDAVSAAYACKDASPESTATWQLSIASPAPERVDVITVIPAKR
jgi:hypothetical protein